jgi:hypothetical protein
MPEKPHFWLAIREALHLKYVTRLGAATLDQLLEQFASGRFKTSHLRANQGRSFGGKRFGSVQAGSRARRGGGGA